LDYRKFTQEQIVEGSTTAISLLKAKLEFTIGSIAAWSSTIKNKRYLKRANY
jgi:hypothetical protein